MIFEEVKEVNKRLSSLIFFLGSSMFILVLLTITFGFKINDIVLRNLQILLKKTKEVEEGQYIISIDNSNFVEFNEIRRSFLSMLDEIKMREDQILSQNYEIESMNRELEERVNARTNELYSANQELEVALENLKTTQDQLVESEKLASLGELVSGLAHEINTPLGIILTVITYLQETTKQVESNYDKGILKKSDFENYINAHVESEHLIYDNISKAIELISSFKLISAEQRNIEKRLVDIKEFIESIVRSVDPKLKKSNIQINMHLEKKIEIETIPIALYQILVNLLMNVKFHAYGDQGGVIDLFVNEHANYLELIIQDYGAGIDDGHMKKIFDPFFTTKRGEGGTGLGLNIVYNTVKQNLKGEIKCYSEMNVGTQFVIHLPYDI
jgi:C4-dicarboxylate-specific signal transduction histidine kinase